MERRAVALGLLVGLALGGCGDGGSGETAAAASTATPASTTPATATATDGGVAGIGDEAVVSLRVIGMT